MHIIIMFVSTLDLYDLATIIMIIACVSENTYIYTADALFQITLREDNYENSDKQTEVESLMQLFC